MIHDHEVLHLYVHVPFCRQRCAYCDFFTRVGASAGRIEEVLRRTRKQVEQVQLANSRRLVKTLYIGGGTPSSLDGVSREVLLEMIRNVVVRNPLIEEVTVELNPEDVDHELLGELAHAGVNRISLGVQSLRDAVLARIGRVGGKETTMNALATMEKEWKSLVGTTAHWSADLIVGIRGYTLPEIQEDLQQIHSAGADHFSIYELSLEKNSVLGLRHRRSLFVPMRSPDVLKQLHGVHNFLRAQGFSRYEISSYAKDQGQGIHNSAYWKMAPHAGCGPGAVGTMPEPWPVRHSVTRDFTRFLGSSDFGIDREPLTRREFLQEVLMMGLRLETGLDNTRFTESFGVSLEQLLPKTLHAWDFARADNHDGSPGRWFVPERHRDLLDSVLVDAFGELDARIAEEPSIDRPWSK